MADIWDLVGLYTEFISQYGVYHFFGIPLLLVFLLITYRATNNLLATIIVGSIIYFWIIYPVGGVQSVMIYLALLLTTYIMRRIIFKQ